MTSSDIILPKPFNRIAVQTTTIPMDLYSDCNYRYARRTKALQEILQEIQDCADKPAYPEYYATS